MGLVFLVLLAALSGCSGQYGGFPLPQFPLPPIDNTPPVPDEQPLGPTTPQVPPTVTPAQTPPVVTPVTAPVTTSAPGAPASAPPTAGTAGPDAAVDGAEVTDSVREAIDASTVEELVDVLVQEDDVTALGQGFQFEDEERDVALTKTLERVEDKDVISFQGIAQAALDTGDAEKFARVVVVAITPEDNVFPEGVVPEELEGNFTEIFSNSTLLEEIVDADPTTDFVPPTGRRRLACDKCTPVNSWVCAHCWPSKACQNLWWCVKEDKGKETKKDMKKKIKEEEEEVDEELTDTIMDLIMEEMMNR